MDTSIIPALAGLTGAAIGGLTSGIASWVAQKTQSRVHLLAQDKVLRQELYTRGRVLRVGHHVIVLGRYVGVTKKGRRVQSRMAHFWTIRDGKVGRLQTTADTLLIAQALGK